MCLYIYIYIHIYIYMYIYICINIHTYVFTNTNAHTTTHQYEHTHANKHDYTNYTLASGIDTLSTTSLLINKIKPQNPQNPVPMVVSGGWGRTRTRDEEKSQPESLAHCCVEIRDRILCEFDILSDFVLQSHEPSVVVFQRFLCLQRLGRLCVFVSAGVCK